MAKQVTETPTGGKLCGRLWPGLNRDRKARKTNRLLHENFLRKKFLSLDVLLRVSAPPW
jgi:hypothetical protein